MHLFLRTFEAHHCSTSFRPIPTLSTSPLLSSLPSLSNKWSENKWARLAIMGHLWPPSLPPSARPRPSAPMTAAVTVTPPDNIGFIRCACARSTLSYRTTQPTPLEIKAMKHFDNFPYIGQIGSINSQTITKADTDPSTGRNSDTVPKPPGYHFVQ